MSTPKEDAVKKLSASWTRMATKKKGICDHCQKVTSELEVATSVSRVYFSVQKDTRYLICSGCKLEAIRFLNRSKKEIRENGNLFAQKPASIGNVAELVDLDVDAQVNEVLELIPDRKESEIEQFYNESEETVNKVVMECIQKYAVVNHINRLRDGLADDIDQLGKDFDELEAQLQDSQKLIDGSLAKCRMLSAPPTRAETGEIDFNEDGSQMNGQSSVRLLGGGYKPEDVPSDIQPFQKPQNRAKRTGFRPKVLTFKAPQVGQLVFAVYTDNTYCWIPATVLQVINRDETDARPSSTKFRVEFKNISNRQECIPKGLFTTQNTDTKERFGHEVSFSQPLQGYNLPVGSRVIGKFLDILSVNPEFKGLYYAGIIAEEKSNANRQRYLIFFDDGFAQYTQPDDVLPVFQSPQPVWRNLKPEDQEFVKQYLNNYPVQNPITYNTDSFVLVNLHGKEHVAQVVTMDCSLVKLKYLGDRDEYEWIYCGSTRISSSRTGKSEAKKENQTWIKDAPLSMISCATVTRDSQRYKTRSTMVNPDTHLDYETAGIRKKIEIPHECAVPRHYKPHNCGPSCSEPFYLDMHRGISPLAVPFYLGWARHVSKDGTKISYITPCGVKLDYYEQILGYNLGTKNQIPIECFALEATIDCLNRFSAARTIASIPDISSGKEWTPIQCVNSLNDELPSFVEYSTTCQPVGISLIQDVDFLVCCDCTDDCMDKSKCSCWQLTLSGISFTDNPEVKGYENRRLKKSVPSGIYECNKRCKCKQSSCTNRATQMPLIWPIQLFRTAHKGWGVRAIYDIPCGSFLCNYVGKILNDDGANDQGTQNGDEYLADLDYIECMEDQSGKEGYESDCSVSIISDDEKKTDSKGHVKAVDNPKLPDTGPTNILPVGIEPSPKKVNLARKSTSGRVKKPEISAASKLPNVPKSNGAKKNGKPVKYRAMFNEHAPYTIDGKVVGNIGRYFNHSCDPNLFIQSVFVDSHDLRFPRVAFFTMRDIKAGEEICWDYKYSIGSVPGKSMYCFCGSKKCRRRLL